MKWSKHKVEIDKLDQLFNDYKKIILKGDADLEHLYYALTYKDNPIIYIGSIFDFIDSYLIIKSLGVLHKFYTYQVLNS